MNKIIIIGGMLIMLILVAACRTEQGPTPIAGPAMEEKTTLMQDNEAAIAAATEADTLSDPEAEQDLDDLGAVLEQVP